MYLVIFVFLMIFVSHTSIIFMVLLAVFRKNGQNDMVFFFDTNIAPRLCNLHSNK